MRKKHWKERAFAAELAFETMRSEMRLLVDGTESVVLASKHILDIVPDSESARLFLRKTENLLALANETLELRKKYDDILKLNKDLLDEHLDLLEKQNSGNKFEPEFVICAAVLTETADIIRCHRHHHGFMAIEQMGKKRMISPRGQGFVTSRNRYVTRQEARMLQNAAGIPSFCGEYRSETDLFSEDLY